MMAIKTVISLFACLMSLQAIAATHAEKKPLPVHYSGRVHIETTPTHETHYTYAWQGTYFEAEFSGPEVDIKLNDAQNAFNIIVDGKNLLVLKEPGKITHSLKSLGEGKHRIRVEKRTENQQGKGVFAGFYIPANQQALAVKARTRTIEFIGDSFTVGYGNESPSRTCKPEEVSPNTNTQVAFGPLAAKHFNADYQINALSGLGVVRNYNGALPDTSLLKQYPYTLNDGGEMYNGPWSPNIIVITLGGNDFSSPLGPNEKWKTRSELQADYVKTYTHFITTLRKKNPDAFFMLLATDDFQREIVGQVNHVVANIKNTGDKRIDSMIIPIGKLDLQGCHFHPSAKDHRIVAQLLIDYIEQRPTLWNK